MEELGSIKSVAELMLRKCVLILFVLILYLLDMSTFEHIIGVLLSQIVLEILLKYKSYYS